VQTQAPVQYGPWETKGWAYYCTGDHLACSSTPPPELQNCKPADNPVFDPGCPRGNIHNYCQFTSCAPPVCLTTYTETCSGGGGYDCHAEFGRSACSRCAAGSKPTLSKRATREKAAAFAAIAGLPPCSPTCSKTLTAK
jgi:hypothetical protein